VIAERAGSDALVTVGMNPRRFRPGVIRGAGSGRIGG
jgi:hypothetical protein